MDRRTLFDEYALALPMSASDRIAQLWLNMAAASGPIIAFNKSHSGSRLLAALLQSAGVFIGSNLNSSNDALDLLDLLRYLITNYYPDYSTLWQPDRKDATLLRLIQESLDNHLREWDPQTATTWGWKLCETTYILPVVDLLFPKAKYIHVIRDGRDVAFCDHRAPHDVYWRKVYFNTGKIVEWRGWPMDKRAYRKNSHIYNAIHWSNSVAVGRFDGSMLRDRYLEVRYEDLCHRFTDEAGRILDFLGLDAPSDVLEGLSETVYTGSIGKYKRQRQEKVQEVLDIAKPLLLSLGYLEDDTRTSSRRKPFSIWPWR